MTRLLFASLLTLILVAAFGAVLMLSPPQAGDPELRFSRATFSDLPGFDADDLAGFETAFQRSCDVLARQRANRALPGKAIAGTVGDWLPLCAAAQGHRGPSLKAFLLAQFTPLSVSAGTNPTGLFTGYYEPVLRGSFTKDETYSVPLYKRPSDLVEVDLGTFRSDLAGRRIAGRVENGRLRPFEDRTAIDAGALAGKAEPLLYVDDPVGAFFLHIQGSGRVRLETGELIGVGYAGQNGHPYFAIGRLLIAEGHARADEMSLQFIRRWLHANPDDAARVMGTNRSFIFFRNLGSGDGPYGSSNAVLTPGRSIAIDRTKVPQHVPLYLATSHPDPANVTQSLPFGRLLMAQDTGGAIRGAVRGDVFWGMGPEAELIAGHMKAEGRMFILLPNAVADRLLSSSASGPGQ